MVEDASSLSPRLSLKREPHYTQFGLIRNGGKFWLVVFLIFAEFLYSFCFLGFKFYTVTVSYWFSYQIEFLRKNSVIKDNFPFFRLAIYINQFLYTQTSKTLYINFQNVFIFSSFSWKFPNSNFFLQNFLLELLLTSCKNSGGFLGLRTLTSWRFKKILIWLVVSYRTVSYKTKLRVFGDFLNTTRKG